MYLSWSVDGSAEEAEVLERLLGVSISAVVRRKNGGGIQKGIRRGNGRLTSTWKHRLYASHGLVRPPCLHWLFLSGPSLNFRRGLLSDAVEEGSFETVGRFFQEGYGLAEGAVMGDHIHGRMVRVSTEQLGKLDTQLTKCQRRVIEVQSLADPSYVVKTYAFVGINST